MSKIIVAAESGADIPQNYVLSHDVYIVPMHVMIHDENRDDGSFPVSDIFDYFDQTGKIPTTSAPAPDEYRVVFERIEKEHPGAEILHMCYSAATSATMQNAKIGSEGMENVRVIDSKCCSAGQAMLVMRTVDYISSHPEADMDGVCECVEKWISQSRMAFIPDDLMYLKAGGRVSNAAYMGASLLSLKPVIEIEDGKLLCTKKYRGNMKHIFQKFLEEKIQQYHYDKNYIYLIYSEGLDEEIRKEAEHFLAERGYINVPWLTTGSAVSVHGGPGAIGIGGYEAV